MYKRIELLLLCAIFALGIQTAVAQDVKIPTDTTLLVSVETTDGNEFIGYIRRIEASRIYISTEKYGEVRIQKKDLRQIKPVEQGQIVEGEYWVTDPNGTRYLFGPNGYGLRKGEGYYQNTWVFFNQVSYGITNNFTLGAGVIPLFIFAGAPTPIWITPKFSIPLKRNKVNLGVGGLFATVLGEEAGSFGVAYGQLTLGQQGRNINIGLGYGYAGDSWANTPTVSLSGIYRTSKKFALLSENYIFDTGDESYLLMSFGGRFIGKRISIDAAFIVPTQTEGEVVLVPWLGLTVPFGKPAG
ncbi:MAG: hypothetical protein EP344_14100 [Bacteroidetes bacterium]|nr:MAG: hypothetical protein EP344_14100 [Bacteroidota bacterium]